MKQAQGNKQTQKPHAVMQGHFQKPVCCLSDARAIEDRLYLCVTDDNAFLGCVCEKSVQTPAYGMCDSITAHKCMQELCRH